MRKFSSYVIAAAVVLALALCPVAARADQTQLSLSYVIPDQYTNPGNFGTVFTGPYATVTVDWINSTTANITFASSGSYYMGDGGSAFGALAARYAFRLGRRTGGVKHYRPGVGADAWLGIGRIGFEQHVEFDLVVLPRSERDAFAGLRFA